MIKVEWTKVVPRCAEMFEPIAIQYFSGQVVSSHRDFWGRTWLVVLTGEEEIKTVKLKNVVISHESKESKAIAKGRKRRGESDHSN